jgi:site-specific DNA-methyltransferase (adenine-specific)
MVTIDKYFKGRTADTRDDWETPPYFFQLLDDEFHFTLDPCASDQNHKCPRYYTEQDDGLSKSWAGETVFVNPPFNQKEPWLKKCYLESMQPNTTVVLLVPAAPDSDVWHKYVMGERTDEIRLCMGRVNFIWPVLLEDGKKRNGSKFPLAVVVFRARRQPYLKVTSFAHKHLRPTKLRTESGVKA